MKSFFSRRRRSPRSPMQRILILVAFGILVIALRRWGEKLPDPHPQPAESPASSTDSSAESAIAHVKRVVDGDTLLLESGVRVRLLGVDTPETKKPNTPIQPFGPEASEFTKQMVEGRDVKLVFDRERYDRYHRTLAFVYIGDLCLNEELIRKGLGTAQLQYPYRSDMKRRFAAAEKEARAQRIGLWSLPHFRETGRFAPTANSSR